MSEGIHISEEALSSLSDDAATGESVRTDLNEKQRSQMRAVWEWVFVVVVAIGAAMFIRLFLFQQYYIDGPSMQTTLMPQDRVLVNKMSYKLHDIHRGDVIVFDRVTTSGGIVEHDDLIKRVIALPGETIEIHECVVSIDGKELPEPYLNDYDVQQVNLEDRCRVPELEPIKVSEDHIFVMGDNRPQSFDSRMFGEIETELVVGRAFGLIWPLSDARWL
jgi:signal peptidase I